VGSLRREPLAHAPTVEHDIFSDVTAVDRTMHHCDTDPNRKPFVLRLKVNYSFEIDQQDIFLTQFKIHNVSRPAETFVSASLSLLTLRFLSFRSPSSLTSLPAIYVGL
jgi:hypothetical protein